MLNCDVMLRYLTYLAIYIPVQLFAYLITPLLPLFAVKRMGGTDNNSFQSIEWRLLGRGFSRSSNSLAFNRDIDKPKV